MIQPKAIRTQAATLARILLVILPIVLIACNKGGGSGY